MRSGASARRPVVKLQIAIRLQGYRPARSPAKSVRASQPARACGNLYVPLVRWLSGRDGLNTVACFRAGLGVFAAFFCVAAMPCAAQGNLDPAVVSAHADAWLKPYQAVGDFSGVVLLAQDDKILFQKAYGLADPQVGLPNRLDTRFRIASVGKTFTAAAIEKLV